MFIQTQHFHTCEHTCISQYTFNRASQYNGIANVGDCLQVIYFEYSKLRLVIDF